jgi:CRISPR-associated endoribonuclease Cas6
LYNELSFYVSFHLPEAMESFVKGLFQSQQVDIADKKSKASFTVKSVESIPNPLQGHKENEIVSFQLSPLSPVVAGLQNEKGNYEFLSPEDLRFAPGIVYNWREKIKACYDDVISNAALLMVDLEFMKNPPKSRLITIKADTDAETKIRGWMNFGLKVTGEKRFVELLLDAGTGVYNSQGMGMVERCE